MRSNGHGMRGIGVLGETWGLVTRNWRTLVAFELCYRLLLVSVMVPVLGLGLRATMWALGYSYLTLENVVGFLTQPLTLAIGAALVLVAATFTMVDVSAVLYVLDLSRQDVSARLGATLRFAAQNSLRVWRPEGVGLVLVVLLLMPLLGAGMACGVLTTLRVPDFIMAYVSVSPAYTALHAVVVALLWLLMMRWTYTLHYFTLERCPFGEAHRRSRALSRGNLARDVLWTLVVQGVFALAYDALLLVSTTAALGVSSVLATHPILRWLATSGVWMAALGSLVVASALVTPVSYGVVSALYYRHRAERGESCRHVTPSRPIIDPRRQGAVTFARAAAVSFVLVVCLAFGLLVSTGALNPEIEYLRTCEVTAHRGASADYPENTMAAFRAAREMGADWVELDVQQTADGVLVVSHDANFMRTTGVDRNVWEMSAAEVAELDAGSSFSREFAGEHVPTLAEVAAYARLSGLRLNIEIKPTGHETDIERAVIDVVRREGIASRCVVTSQSYASLVRVKEIDPTIQTVYVMSLAYGDITSLTAADHFSIEATSATRSLVRRVHNAGGQVLAWTVNSEDSIRRMVDRNVDNIVTDDVALARRCVQESRYSDLLREFLKLLG